MLPVCHSLWLGETMPPLLASCLETFVRHGHRVVLWAYRRLPDLPRGIELSDAAEVLPFERVGLPSMDRRVAGIRGPVSVRTAGFDGDIWIDADLICLRPLTFKDAYLFAYESRTQINNAVLRLPAGSTILHKLRALFPGTGLIPPWFGPARKFRYHVRRLVGIHRDISTLPISSTGPRALTWYAGTEGVAHHAKPVDVFYPLRYHQSGRVLEASFELASIVTPRTCCVHLWHSGLPRTTPEPGSVAARLLARDFPSLR
jgi:hypothetical protein